MTQMARLALVSSSETNGRLNWEISRLLTAAKTENKNAHEQLHAILLHFAYDFMKMALREYYTILSNNAGETNIPVGRLQSRIRKNHTNLSSGLGKLRDNELKQVMTYFYDLEGGSLKKLIGAAITGVSTMQESWDKVSAQVLKKIADKSKSDESIKEKAAFKKAIKKFKQVAARKKELLERKGLPRSPAVILPTTDVSSTSPSSDTTSIIPAAPPMNDESSVPAPAPAPAPATLPEDSSSSTFKKSSDSAKASPTGISSGTGSASSLLSGIKNAKNHLKAVDQSKKEPLKGGGNGLSTVLQSSLENYRKYVAPIDEEEDDIVDDWD